MAQVKTVQIVSPAKSGYTIINEADFDPKLHTKFGEKAKPAAKPKKAPKK